MQRFPRRRPLGDYGPLPRSAVEQLIQALDGAARVLAANPGLREELQEYDRRAANGESVWEFLSSDELRRRLGLPRRHRRSDRALRLDWSARALDDL